MAYAVYQTLPAGGSDLLIVRDSELDALEMAAEVNAHLAENGVPAELSHCYVELLA